MVLELFSEKSGICSPLYCDELDSNHDFPYVYFNAEVTVSSFRDEDLDEREIKSLDIRITNTSWKDPVKKYGEQENVSVFSELKREQVIHLNKYLEAYLEATKNE